jgi:hypothetical protein
VDLKRAIENVNRGHIVLKRFCNEVTEYLWNCISRPTYWSGITRCNSLEEMENIKKKDVKIDNRLTFIEHLNLIVNKMSEKID